MGHPTVHCPRCVYPLSGLTGVPAQTCEPTTAPVHCPECGLHVPTGSYCLVSVLGAAKPSQGGSFVKARPWLLPLMMFGGAIVLGGMVFLIDLAVLLWRGVGAIPGGNVRIGAVGWMMVLAAMLAGVVIPLIAVEFWHRRLGVLRESGSPRALGQAGDRILVAPGGLWVYRGAPSAPRLACAGGDVRRVVVRRTWRFTWSPGAPELMALWFHLPVQVRYSGMVGGRYPASAEVLPADLARRLIRVLRSAPAPGMKVPAAVTAPAPSAPPICPACSAALKDIPHAAGVWYEPLEGDVACPACAFRASRGACVLTGGSAFNALYASPRGKLVIAMLGSMMFSSVVIMLVRFLFRGYLPEWLVPILDAFGSLLWVFVALGVWGAMAIAGRNQLPPPVEGRFQQGSETWVFEPGVLTMITRRKRSASSGAERQGAGTRVAARGISRVVFWTPETAGSAAVGTDLLQVTGLAPELGFMSERALSLVVPAGVDCDELARNLQALLHSPAPATPVTPASPAARA